MNQIFYFIYESLQYITYIIIKMLQQNTTYKFQLLLPYHPNNNYEFPGVVT